MHVIRKIYWPKYILFVGLISIVLAVLVVPKVQAQSATPTASCNASKTSCTVSFPYSGDYYVWTPPADVRSMTTVFAGAQGGRNGGNGSRVSATFRSIPTTPLYIYVGGQGSSGNGAAGGFNGGGAAGSGHNDEGSGGGATDIRTSTLLTDRIAVAGGGGGTGGWVGGAGGSAGGVNGGAGANGQGSGGGGGTPTAGGSGGASFGAATTPGTAGAQGVGGTGGSATTPGSLVSGGGGGGGGYFGGGGGGADTDPAGADGGGGGAGSSYMNSSKFQLVTYYTAYQPGDGMATITYNLGPAVTAFSTPASPSNAVNPVFNLSFGQSVTGLTADDFTFSGAAAGCYVSLLTGSGANYAATVSGCSDGTISLTLKADSVMGNAIGPVRPVSTAQIILDRTLPEISNLTKQVSSNDQVVYRAQFSETVTGLSTDATDWLVKGDGCLIQSLTGSGNDYTITITGCLDGHLAALVLNPQSVIDTAGNIGPSLPNQTGVTKIDTSPPVIHVIDVTEPGVAGIPSWVFDAEEPVTGMTQSKFTVSGTATNCATNYAVLRSGLGWQLTLTGCSVGTVQVSLSANSVADLAGNLGPVAAVASTVQTLTPDEVVNQRITPPSPNQGSSVGITLSEPKSEVEEVVTPEIQTPDTGVSVTPEQVKEVKPPKGKPAQQTGSQLPLGLLVLAAALGFYVLASRRRVGRRH